MNKTDLIEIAAIKTSTTKKTANTLLNAFINAITAAVVPAFSAGKGFREVVNK